MGRTVGLVMSVDILGRAWSLSAIARAMGRTVNISEYSSEQSMELGAMGIAVMARAAGVVAMLLV